MSDNAARPLFSVIIACYNYGHLLPRAIESVLAQIYTDYEVIVVDDGSTDNTAEAVQPYLERVYYHRQKNAGHCATNNQGASLAQGAYCYFLDADDELLPTALAAFAQAIAAAPEVPVWFGGYISVAADGSERAHRGGDLPAAAAERLQAYIMKQAVGLKHGSTVLQRRIFSEMQYPANLRNNTDIVFFGQVIARFPARGIHSVVVKSHEHAQRVRKQRNLTASTGLSVVDIFFDPQVIPAELMLLKPLYRQQKTLSLARALYRNAQYRDAADYYLAAIKVEPMQLLNFNTVKRFLLSLLKSL